MTANVEFMKALEEDYRKITHLRNRAEYKIFYGQVFQAPILALGLNPGGDPEGTSEDGMLQRDGSRASASASFFEGMENDVLDCEWKENIGLRRLILPLVGNDRERFRHQVVKTNIAFRRSRAVKNVDLAEWEKESAPFVERLLARISPKLIVLTGVPIERFVTGYALEGRPLTETIKAHSINHVVFAASMAQLRATGRETIVVQVAHASQFSWTYEKYGVCAKIAELIGSAIPRVVAPEEGVQSSTDESLVERPLNPGRHLAPKMPIRSPTVVGSQRLSELKAQWEKLGIASQFWQVHHSASPKFSSKRETLNGFVNWCGPRDIRDENSQTLQRAIELGRRIVAGRSFAEALNDSWAAYPTVTR